MKLQNKIANLIKNRHVRVTVDSHTGTTVFLRYHSRRAKRMIDAQARAIALRLRKNLMARNSSYKNCAIIARTTIYGLEIEARNYTITDDVIILPKLEF